MRQTEPGLFWSFFIWMSAGIADKKRVFKTGNNRQELIFIVPYEYPKPLFADFTRN
jgi:hypothetical protein